jgi:diadenosine tetraphosphate (Ap4A) HIT family hydrolase
MVTEDAVAVPPRDPFTACHVVVAPVRHVETFYDLDVQEQRAVWMLVQEIRTRISASLKVDVFHVGFADGDHAHVHVVPAGPGESPFLPHGIEWVDPDR